MFGTPRWKFEDEVKVQLAIGRSLATYEFYGETLETDREVWNLTVDW